VRGFVGGEVGEQEGERARWGERAGGYYSRPSFGSTCPHLSSSSNLNGRNAFAEETCHWMTRLLGVMTRVIETVIDSYIEIELVGLARWTEKILEASWFGSQDKRKRKKH